MKREGSTRERILAAASAEFAQHGIAGARVDRIAAAAQANKAQLYTYFGNKSSLFEAVFSIALDSIVNTVPIDGEDLPGYAVRLYDEYLENPELVRLATWARLERQSGGHLTSNTDVLDEAKIHAIEQGQKSGHIDPWFEPFDVLTTVIAMSMTWSPASATFTAARDDAAEDHDRRREVLRRIVGRAFPPAA